ncbi:MAG: AAA family ATPase [Anaerolineales bacterium]|nr:AAA family ATPase [Anaerolineales bacterium]MCB8940081.1 AAA family ATPase [Ardenticatenaceae bacterium]
MNPSTAFLPLDRRHVLVTGASLPDRTSGTVLFADISGFTPLTAALAAELGPHRGAEELTRLLNHVYTRLIACVHEYHGSVITFSGDAITCWFDDATPDPPSAELGLACARKMQSVMQQLDVAAPSGRAIHLGLKVALTYGSCRRFLVGNPGTQQIEVLAGRTLDRMAAAEKVATDGDIIVTAEFLAALTTAPEIVEWRTDKTGEPFARMGLGATAVSPIPWPDLPPLDPNLARPWHHAPVFARLQQAPDEFLAELRHAVVIFVKFSGIHYDADDEAGIKLDTFIRHVQAVLGRYEGFLLQITMGDKGSYLYIVFGALIAHEDDAARAAAAVLELRQLPDALPFLQRLQIGVSRGLMHSGAYGSPHRRTFGVIGDHVNIAARLMTTAQPDQILLSGPVVDSLKTDFVVSALPPVQLKGVAQPFAIWALQGRKTAVSFSQPTKQQADLVGREAEQQQLVDALAHLENGRSTILLIEGAAGIGKSRLVQALMEQANQREIRLLLGQGDAIDKSTPYHAWSTIFAQLFNLKWGELDNETLQAELLAQLPEAVRQLAPLLTAVLPITWPDNELTAQIEGEARQENTHNLLITILQMAAQQPLVLVLEDAHWLDSLSWALTRRVPREVDQLILVVVTRPFAGDSPAVHTELKALPNARTLALETLPLAAVNQLVCQRLGVERLPPIVARLIHDKAEGNPFFSEELAYALRDSRLIEIKAGVCQPTAELTRLTAVDFPNTIQGVIISRIDLLAPKQQLTVKVASVIGRIFAFRILQDIYPISTTADELEQDLVDLEQLDITPQETPEPDLSYIFKHIVTQEVVYSLMTFSQRQQLHENTAVWYETALRGEPTRLYPLLAHHWREAGDIAKAVEYYAKAGTDAFQKYANQEAIRFLTEALTLSDQLGPETRTPFERVRWLGHLGEATYRLTIMDESQRHYETALTQLGYTRPKGNLRLAVGLVGQLLKQVRHRWWPGRYVGHAAATPRRAELLEAARLFDGVAEIYYNEGDFLSSFFGVMHAFNLAEEAGTSAELVRGYANMCATMGSVSLNGIADNYRVRAVEMAAQIDDLTTRASIQIPLSSHSLWVGNWARAEQEIGEALDIYERLGDWRHWCVAAWLWPQVIQGQGALADAQKLWAELLAVAKRSNDTRHQVRSLGGQAFNFWATGNHEAALVCVADVEALLGDFPTLVPVEERLWHALAATKAWHEGNWREAHAQAQSLLEAIERARFKFDLMEVFATAAEVLLSLFEQGEATRADAEVGCRAFNQYAQTYAFARSRAQRCRGKLAWLTGKQRRARKLWRQSVSQAAALGMPHEQGATWQQMGHYLQDSAYLAQAQQVANATGAVFTNGRPTAPTSATTAARD